jgi:hypothetical protein
MGGLTSFRDTKVSPLRSLTPLTVALLSMGGIYLLREYAGWRSLVSCLWLSPLHCGSATAERVP